MKKKNDLIKKMIALCMTVFMLISIAIPAFAEAGAAMPTAGGTGTLKVKVDSANNSLENQTISLYKLFDLSKQGDNYTYTVTVKYKDALKQSLNITDLNPEDKVYYDKVFALKGEAIQKFADDFTTYALTNSLAADKTSGKIPKELKVTEYDFKGLEYGYYLVYQTGTKDIQSSLVSVGDETPVVITLKGEAPNITKEADKETVEIGHTVAYTITGIIPDTTGYNQYAYKLKDTLSAGLDFVDKAGTAPVGNDYNVTVQIETQQEETKTATLGNPTKRDMVLDLSEWVRNNQAHKGKKFTVKYYAKVNSAAVVDTHNSAKLEYGNDPDSTTITTPVVVTTPTYPLDINKTEADHQKIIAGAVFRLYRDTVNAEAANDQAIKVTGTDGKYTVDVDQKNGQNMDMITVDKTVGGNYNLHLNGLAAGDYWLVETKAPSGYNKLAKPIKITITKNVSSNLEWSVSKDDLDEPDKIIDIVNERGTILPETGGMGTFLFTAVAVIMILGVGISFVRSRKTEE